MEHLKDQQYRVIPMRDLEAYIDAANPAADPMTTTRYRRRGLGSLLLPVEMATSRKDQRYWLKNMLGPHQFSTIEAGHAEGEQPPIG